MKKKLFALLLAGMMVLSLAACGGGSGGSSGGGEAAGGADDAGSGGVDPSQLKVGIIMKSSDEFQNAVVEGAKAAAADLGIPAGNVRNVAATSESDAMQQVTACEDMISNGVDILLVSCQEENALVNVLQKAADAGIKVVMVDTDCGPFTDKVTFIGTDNYEAALNGAREFATHLNQGDNVVILRGKLGDVNHERRTEGLEAALADAGINVLEVQDANCEVDKAANAMDAFLTKYAGQINGVMVTSDSMAIGAASAIKSAGVEGIKVCGFDGFQAAIQLFGSDEIDMIIAQRPYEIGYMGVQDGFGALQGESYESYIDPGIAIIDQDNYTDYQK